MLRWITETSVALFLASASSGCGLDCGDTLLVGGFSATSIPLPGAVEQPTTTRVHLSASHDAVIPASQDYDEFCGHSSDGITVTERRDETVTELRLAGSYFAAELSNSTSYTLEIDFGAKHQELAFAMPGEFAVAFDPPAAGATKHVVRWEPHTDPGVSVDIFVFSASPVPDRYVTSDSGALEILFGSGTYRIVVHRTLAGFPGPRTIGRFLDVAVP
jgi:hypothetical protein